MKIHEYQAKAILAKFGVPVPRGEFISKKEDAEGVARRLGTPVVVVKAQIHAGGRGKGGGVKLARSPQQAVAGGGGAEVVGGAGRGRRMAVRVGRGVRLERMDNREVQNFLR